MTVRCANICHHCNKKLLAKHRVDAVDPIGNPLKLHKWCFNYKKHIERKEAFNVGAARVGARGAIK